MRWLAAALLALAVPLVLTVSILTGLLVVQVDAGMKVLPVHDALAIAFLIVGWLIVLRNPINPVGWLFLVIALLPSADQPDRPVRHVQPAWSPAWLAPGR
jgi:hypothetical protein